MTIQSLPSNRISRVSRSNDPSGFIFATNGGIRSYYDLSRFAAETNCVVVTFNYRLNLYGFLNLRFLDRGFDQNNGLYDQIAALQFVKENITAFGGDPNNITVFGQSAGGACILALMTMRDAVGLFHKAIVQSACIEHFFTEQESRRNTQVYLKYAGVKNPQDLLVLPEEAVKRANTKYSSAILRRGDIRCAFSPVIDGTALTAAPKDTVWSGFAHTGRAVWKEFGKGASVHAVL